MTVNGQSVTACPARLETTLLDVLRERGWTGAKESCAEGECGACAVAFVEPDGPGSAYRAVNSCLVLAPQGHGQEILTVDGIAEPGAMSNLLSHGASQCGYCTSGFAVSLFAEQYRKGRNGACDPRAVEGNLCRCTGYRPIRDAVLAAGPPPDGPLLRRMAEPAPVLEAFELSRNGQRFYRPGSLAECLDIVDRDPAVRWIAGGTDLAVEANLRRSSWPSLASLEAVPEALAYSESRNGIRIGAALPLARIAELWRSAPPAFSDWLARFGSPAIRQRATLGGNLCTASPIGDAAPLLMALHASLEVASRAGIRRIAVSSFFTGYRTTALQAGEIVLAIDIPLPLPEILRFYKASKRWLNDISTVAAAFSFRGGRPVLAYGGMAATPIRVTGAERALGAQPLHETAIRHAASLLEASMKPLSDHRGSAGYRREVAKSLLWKFWRDCR